MREQPEHQNRSDAEVIEQLVAVCNRLILGAAHFEAKDLAIRPLQNGTLNSIYHVELRNIPKSVPSNQNIPGSFVVKLLTSQAKLPYDLSNCHLTNQVVGESCLGPRVHLVLERAIIMEHIASSRIINMYDDQKPRYRRTLAQRMAQFHLLQMPIERNEHEKYVRHVLERWLSPAILHSLESGPMRDTLIRFGCSKLIQVAAFRREISYLKETILADVEHVMVFAHNDLNRSNVLVVERDDQASQDDDEEVELKLIDFDFSRYFYRGADFGRYFMDYRDPSVEDTEENPDASGIPESVMREYIHHYRQECARILNDPTYLDDPRNSADKILREAKLFMLFSCVLNIIYGLWVSAEGVDKDEDTRDGCLVWADICFGQYLRMKARFQADGSVP